jgi:hypothetical protein
MAILKGIETMVGVKKAYRRELAARRERENLKVRERFAAKASAINLLQSEIVTYRIRQLSPP